MKRFLLIPAFAFASALSAQAILRQPMDGHFGIDKVLGNKNAEVQLDSIRSLGEWGGWVDSMAFYRYDAKGRLTLAEGFNGNNVKVSNVNVVYGKDGSYKLTENVSYDGRNISWVFVYNYDKDNKLTEFSKQSIEGKYTQHTQIAYKSKKNQLVKVYTSADGGENATAKYGVNGRLESVDYGNRQLTYNYNDKGHLVSVVENENGVNTYLKRNVYTYDAKNRIETFASYTKDGANQDSVKGKYTYNNDDKVIRCAIGNNFTDFTYNKFGNVVMETRVESNNIYGAKNKTYFYKPVAPNAVAKSSYDLSAYPAGSPVATYGKLQVKNSQLCDKNGNPVQLRGMSTHGVQWFTNIYTDPKAINTLVQNWNINVLRVAMYVQENGYATNNVKSDLEWNSYIDSVSSLCAKQGIYCIIDWHILNPGDPLSDANVKKAYQFWEYMSKKHAKDAHVLYEICNEPNGGDVSWPRVREYGRAIISTIRKNDNSTVCLVGTPVWSQDIDVAALAQIEDPDVMYTLHFYSGTHGQAFRQRGERALSAPYKTPIFITEFGTSDASGDNGFFREATLDWLDWAKKNNLSWCNWSFADKGESSSALKNGAASTGFNSLTESGSLIRSVLRDPSMNSLKADVENKNN